MDCIKTSSECLDYDLYNIFNNSADKIFIEYKGTNKASKIRYKKEGQILNTNTLYFDVETATNKLNMHQIYYNYFMHYFHDQLEEEKEYIYNKNDPDIKLQFFNDLMRIITYQDKQFNKANTPKLRNHWRNPLYLCSYNGSNFDLYFFVNELLKSNYNKIYETRTIYKNSCLVYFSMINKQSGRVFLISHDLC